ncbi:hypothetical protein EIN_405520 [Entamoeba invadens IP1]|uniref:Vacuolar protein sorting-associated protein n=1 Tax=Entamoeba invadens IP1 TaxID=370355 RepID=A0A0A1U6T5_ENTIV|nr:hypothetical protein EIN_405520 [Entamoeba invadens IP1]ELP90128.1 hypothetical protein EIN_405520 [Entamoeba invadens IP1]|eukprot:XP_004256899.1 hypothetical protein EIN_405520 [Entamoeba invadens IP1]
MDIEKLSEFVCSLFETKDKTLMKFLVVDDVTSKIMWFVNKKSKVTYNVMTTTLQKEGYNDRSYADAIYIISTQSKTLETLISHLQHPSYHSYYIYFVEEVSDHIIEMIGTADIFEVVDSLKVIPLAWKPETPNLFTTQFPSSKGIISYLKYQNARPTIVYQKFSEKAKNIAIQICGNTQEESDETLLLILDRGFDPYTPFLPNIGVYGQAVEYGILNDTHVWCNGVVIFANYTKEVYEMDQSTANDFLRKVADEHTTLSNEIKRKMTENVVKGGSTIVLNELSYQKKKVDKKIEEITCLLEVTNNVMKKMTEKYHNAEEFASYFKMHFTTPLGKKNEIMEVMEAIRDDTQNLKYSKMVDAVFPKNLRCNGLFDKKRLYNFYGLYNSAYVPGIVKILDNVFNYIKGTEELVLPFQTVKGSIKQTKKMVVWIEGGVSLVEEKAVYSWSKSHDTFPVLLCGNKVLTPESMLSAFFH